MILSGKEIVKHIGKEIIIEPFDPKRVNPNSYNLSLANELLVYDNDVLDMKTPNTAHRIEIPEEGLLLQPNRLYLGRTNEYTVTDRYIPMLEGRSSTEMCIRDRPYAARTLRNNAGLPAHEYGTGGRAANAVTALLSIRKLGV